MEQMPADKSVEMPMSGKGKEEQTSNYEKLCLFWQERFLTMDQEKILARVPSFSREGEYLAVTYYGKRYGIDSRTGEILCLDQPGRVLCTSWNVRMNIYNLCWFSREGAHRLDRWVPFRDVRDASPFTAAFQRNVLDPFGATFNGHTDRLRAAAEALGGTPLPQSDVGYEIPSFSCTPLRFFFWDGDEEFGAQGNILFDYSVTDFIHVETTVTLASDGLRRLAEEAGLPLKGSRF